MSMQEQAVNKAVAILSAIGAKYKIILEDGTEFGELEAVVKSEKKRQFLHPRGFFKSYFIPFVENVKVGERAEVPVADFDYEELRGPISSYCVRNWGKDTYMTAINKEKHVIEVLRYL